MLKRKDSQIGFSGFVIPLVLLLVLTVFAGELTRRVGKIEKHALEAETAWVHLDRVCHDRYSCRAFPGADGAVWQTAVEDFRTSLEQLQNAFGQWMLGQTLRERLARVSQTWEKTFLRLEDAEILREKWLETPEGRQFAEEGFFRLGDERTLDDVWMYSRLQETLASIETSGEVIRASLQKTAGDVAVFVERLDRLVKLSVIIISLLIVVFAYRYVGAIYKEKSETARDLAQSEENLRITLNSIGDGVISLDADGNLVQMNPVAEKMVGWTIDETRGKPMCEFVRLVDRFSRQPYHIPSCAELSKRECSAEVTEIVLVGRGGEERVVADTCSPILDAANRPVGTVLVLRDVTQEHSLHQQLQQAQKMEAIGQLAGGVAHDFNNLLAAILGHAQLLEKELPEGGSEASSVTDIIRSAKRATELSRKLLDLSRKTPAKFSRVDINDLILEVCNLLEHSIDRKIEISHNLAEGQVAVQGDSTQLQNALLNLGLNARDAMPKGGTITFETRRLFVDDAYCQRIAEPFTPGPCIQITVTDTGMGIPPHLLHHVFEPFFTTKTNGKGTGLGLASVYGCVTAHKGVIRMKSKTDQGTEFSLLLPASDEQEDASQSQVLKAVHGEGHILIVDDEEVVNKLAAKALTTLGYEVSTAADGLEALNIFHEKHDGIDLVLLDMVMPRMDGPTAFARMQELDPGVPVLLCSGFSCTEALSGLLKNGAAGFVAKPYRIDQLSNEISRILSERKGEGESENPAMPQG